MTSIKTMLHYAVAHRSTRHTSISLETPPSWQKTSQMQTDSPKKFVPRPHRQVTGRDRRNGLGGRKKSTDIITTTIMLPIGEEKIFYPRAIFTAASQQNRAQSSLLYLFKFMIKNPIISPRIRLNFQFLASTVHCSLIKHAKNPR